MSAMKLTEADLDAAIADRSPVPPNDEAPQFWDEERESPWLLALYAAGLFAAIAFSALAPWGIQS